MGAGWSLGTSWFLLARLHGSGRESTVGALIVTYTTLGVPYWNYGFCSTPKPYSNYEGPYIRDVGLGETFGLLSRRAVAFGDLRDSWVLKAYKRPAVSENPMS